MKYQLFEPCVYFSRQCAFLLASGRVVGHFMCSSDPNHGGPGCGFCLAKRLLAWAICRRPSFVLALRAHLILSVARAPVLFQVVLVLAKPPSAKALEHVLVFLGSDPLP